MNAARRDLRVALPYAERALALDALKPLRRCGSFGRGDPIERLLREISGTRWQLGRPHSSKNAIAGSRKASLSCLSYLAAQYSSGTGRQRDLLSNSTRTRCHRQSIFQRARQPSAQSRPSGVVDARAESGLVCRQRSTLFRSISGMPCVSHGEQPSRRPSTSVVRLILRI